MTSFANLFNSKNILFVLLLLLIFFKSIFPIFDNDVWWHLKTGQFIASNFQIPFFDIFSYTINNKPWVSFEWLAELILFLVSFAFGLSGLTIFKALLVSLIFFLLIKNSLKSNQYVTILILGLSFFIIRDGLRERPQIFSYLLTALYLYILHLKPSNKIYYLFFLQVLWANLHGASCFIGFGLVLLTLIFSKDYLIKTKFFVITAAFFAIFLNPHTYKILLYLYVFFNEGFNKLILEYQPPQISAAFLPYFIFVFITAGVFVLDRKKDITEILLVSISFIASALAIRNIPLFIIISAPFVAVKFSRVFKGRVNSVFMQKLEASNRGALFNIIFGVLFVSLFFVTAKATDTNKKFSFGLGDAHKARRAAEFMVLNNLTGPIFNDYDFGGYLIYKLYPKQKVFVDGRLVEYGAGFIKDAFYYFRPEIWQKLNSRYAFNSAVIAQENYYPAQIFDADRTWTLVYWDDNALVYVKNNQENSRLVKAFGYSILKPNSPNQLYLKNFPKEEVIKEINRSIYAAPYCIRAKALKSLFDKISNKL